MAGVIHITNNFKWKLEIAARENRLGSTPNVILFRDIPKGVKELIIIAKKQVSTFNQIIVLCGSLPMINRVAGLRPWGADSLINKIGERSFFYDQFFKYSIVGCLLTERLLRASARTVSSRKTFDVKVNKLTVGYSTQSHVTLLNAS